MSGKISVKLSYVRLRRWYEDIIYAAIALWFLLIAIGLIILILSISAFKLEFYRGVAVLFVAALILFVFSAFISARYPNARKVVLKGAQNRVGGFALEVCVHLLTACILYFFAFLEASGLFRSKD